MNTIARILVRKESEVGLFVPVGKMDNRLEPGLYDLRSILGEHVIVRVGDPVMPQDQLGGHPPDSLWANRELTLMTKDELES